MFLDAGCPQRGARIYSGGVMLGEADDSLAPSRYRSNVGVSEEVTNSILTDYLHEMGGTVMRRSGSSPLTSKPDGVVAALDRDGERYEIEGGVGRGVRRHPQHDA